MTCDCGEDGYAGALECWRCNRVRCEDCATLTEVDHQCCRECQEELKMSGRDKA